ncbi:MAG: hypothetical protein R2820_12135 [Cyclobacteriaceae bacterium]
MKYLIFIAILSLGTCKSKAQEYQTDSCNQKTPFSFVKKRLSAEICVPLGYVIVSIEEIDINLDGLNDKIVKYYSDYPRQSGDSTFFSLYSKEPNGSFRFLRTYGNLASIYFTLQDQDKELVLNDSSLNSIKNRYQYFGNEPRFIGGEVIISFYVDAAKYLKMFFAYSEKDIDYRLARKETWFAPRTSTWEGDEKLIDTMEYEKDSLLLRDFDMLDYLF